MENQQEADEGQNRRLVKRIAVSLVILAGLAGSLALFDGMQEPDAAAAVQMAVLPGTENPAAAPQPSQPAAKTEDLVRPQAVAADVQPLPAVADEKSYTVPAAGRLIALETTGKGSVSEMPPEQAPVTRGPAKVAAVPQRPAASPDDALQRPFALQMGVFSKVANAEQLRAKLEQNGIPASIEARVHVGPFATRDEADAARLKLKDLGMKESLLITRKPRPPT